MDQRIIRIKRGPRRTRINADEEKRINELHELARMKKGTIEYLFKDYPGERFKTELTNPLEPFGEEKW